MKLGRLIEMLAAHPDRCDDLAPWGLANPHSYRGYYDQLAFEPTVGVTIGAMLADARNSVGSTFEGWKGGSYTMDVDTEVWVAESGDTNPDDEPLSEAEVRLILNSASPQPVDGALDPQVAVDDAERAFAHVLAVELYRRDVIRRIDRDTEDLIRVAVREAKVQT